MSTRKICSSCLRTLQRQGAQPAKLINGNTTFQRSMAATARPKRSPITKAPSNDEKLSSRTAGSSAQTAKTSDQQPAEVVGGTESPSLIHQLAVKARVAAPDLTEPYRAYGSGELLVKECARVADYTMPERTKDVEIALTPTGEELGKSDSWWYREFGLLPTFNTWAHITMLHVHLVVTRLRMWRPEQYKVWDQQITNHFFYMAEERMATYHDIGSKMMRSRYLKDLNEQYRGVRFAYDYGIAKDDMALAAAVWRNVCKADEDVDLTKLAMVVSYVRSAMVNLEKLEDAAIADADIIFGNPGDEAEVVKIRSSSMGAMLSETPSKAPAKTVQRKSLETKKPLGKSTTKAKA